VHLGATAPGRGLTGPAAMLVEAAMTAVLVLVLCRRRYPGGHRAHSCRPARSLDGPAWPSVFNNLPTDPAAKAISDGARDLTAGQGHSVDPQAVDKVGMDMVTAYFSPPWKVEHVDREKCGWDITATLADARLCIEVKATSGPAPTVYVTANELNKAETNPDWVMAVVTNALAKKPLLRWHTAAEVVAAVKPVVYRARLDAAAGSDRLPAPADAEDERIPV